MAEEDYDELRDLLHDHRDLHRLTSLQIGDMNSYVSRLFLHLNCDGTKLVFLVDNDPWSLKNWRSKPAELWQLMVTQSRASPFANRRLKAVQEESGCINGNAAAHGGPTNKFAEDNLFSIETCRMILQDERCIYKPFQNVVRKHLKSLARANELSNLLHGCVSFELSWENVRGINYVNELQTDTCVALEAKVLKKRDFDSLQQALSFYETIQNDAKNKKLTPRRRSTGSFWGSECSESSILSKPSSKECIKLKRNPPGGGLKREVANCMSSSKSISDRSGTCGLKNRRTCSTDFYSCFREHGSVDFFSDCLSPEISKTDGKKLQSDKCFYFDALECCLDTTEQASSGECHCNHSNVLVNTLEKSAQKQSARDEPNSCFRKIGQIGSCKEIYISPGANTCSFGKFHEEHSACFCCKDQEENGMETHSTCAQNAFVSNVYRDVLVLFRFCDPILPLKLKKIITVDQRLLKLLESGLPSWVIFFQSYPIFCSVYRPWMWPLARTIYVLASIVTVIIGFYDLYKNVPILKSTAAHICGPLFDWIEAWEMVSRLKYLGTMLILQNCEKAFKWLLMIVRTIKHLASLLMKPMVEPFRDLGVYISPIWSVVVEGGFGFGVHLCTLFSSTAVYVNYALQPIIWPIHVFLTAIWQLVTLLLYPVFSAIWAVIIFPLQLILGFVNLILLTICSLLKIFESIWQYISYSIQIMHVSHSLNDANPSSTQLLPLWRTLPSDLLSKVFRAIRSIVNGFVAFFAACNRHRLSIYNHLSAFLLQMVDFLGSAHSLVSNTCQRIHKLPLPSDDKLQEEIFPGPAVDSSISLPEQYTDQEATRARQDVQT